MKMKRTIVLTFVLLASLFLAKASFAATYYVATTGSDSNDGSIERPFQTIAHAIVIAKPGDTVSVRAGTYNEEIIIGSRYGINPGGTPGNYLTVQAYPGEEVILLNRMLTEGKAPGITNGAHYVRIKGFHFIGWKGQLGMGGDHIEALNNTFTGSYTVYSGAINVMGNDNLVEGNVLNLEPSGNPGNDHGIYVMSGGTFLTYNVTVRNNIIKGAMAWGIHLYDELKQSGDAMRYITNITIENNYIENSRSRGGILVTTGTHVQIDNVIVRNNLIKDSYYFGILVGSADYGDSKTTNVKVYNNIIYNVLSSESYAAGIYINNVVSLNGVELKNNIIYTNNPVINHIYREPKPSNILADNNLYYPAPAKLYGISDANKIEGDPKFTNIATGDFHLQSGSAAIDKGLTLAEVPKDKDGVSRPQGSAYDIGAYEYISGSTSFPKGDINQDTKVNSIDIQLAVNIILNLENNQQFVKNADLNNDGDANAIDLQLIVNIVLGV